MKSRQTTQNWLYCTLVGVLGLYASTYDAMVDRMTARFLLDARMIGILMSVYAAGSLTSVLLPACCPTRSASAASCCSAALC